MATYASRPPPPVYPGVTPGLTSRMIPGVTLPPLPGTRPAPTPCLGFSPVLRPALPAKALVSPDPARAERLKETGNVYSRPVSVETVRLTCSENRALMRHQNSPVAFRILPRVMGGLAGRAAPAQTRARFRRNELVTTLMELAAIAISAIRGWSIPNIASGTATRL